MRRLKVGWVGYVNILPLAPALAAVPGIELVDAVPTRLNAMLQAGDLDVAPISSVEYARHSSEYLVLPGLSISSDGPTRSVLVASDVDFVKKPRNAFGGPEL